MKISNKAPEWEKCKNDFAYWCKTYCFIENKETHCWEIFNFYPCQERIAEMLTSHLWLWILKARRLGLTWLLIAYSVWLVTFHEERNVFVVNQTYTYAKAFVRHCKNMIRRLPSDQRMMFDTKAMDTLRFPNGSSIQAAAPTENNIHSVAGDLIIFDEGSRIKLLREMLAAAQPAVETAQGGQIVCISTSNGPQGDFYNQWRECKKGASRYVPIFLHWNEHPKRDAAWYEKEKKENEADPNYMKRQYPESAEQAFEFAEGRIYPMFIDSPKFIHEIKVDALWKKYRAIDWGVRDAFVCLWGAVIPGDGPGLTIDPSCKNTIDEILAYSYDDNGKPQENKNHSMDALRYMVTTPGNNGITGHLHIYREAYFNNAAAHEYSLTDQINLVIEKTKSEEIAETIADRTRPDSLNQLRQMGIPNRGQKSMRSAEYGEVIQGITHVNNLVVGTAKASSQYAGLKALKPAPVNTIGGFF